MSEIGLANLKKKKITSYEIPKNLKELIKQITYFLTGIVISRGIVFEKYSPFAPAMLSSVPYKNSGAFLIGSILGYLFPSSLNLNVSYIAASITIISMRWALNDLGNIKSSSFFAPVITIIPVAIMSTIISLSNGFSLNVLITVITDSSLAFISAFFFSKTLSLTLGKKKITSLSEKELTYSAISACILIMSLSFFFIFNLSLGKILANFGILFFSYYLGVTGGAISGASVAGVFCLASPSFSYISGTYVLSSIVSGIISRFGKIFCVLFFLFANVAMLIQKQDINNNIENISEIIIASILFFAISQETGLKFVKLLLKPSNKEQNKRFFDMACSKLDFISKTIMNVSESLGKTWKKLYNLDKKEFKEKEFEILIEKTCNKCNLKTLCWTECKEETTDIFKKIQNRIQQNRKENINKEDFSKIFQKRCYKIDELVKNINILKAEQDEKEIAKQKINEIEEAISKQFSYISEILSELSIELEQTENIDTVLSEEIFSLLKKNALLPIRAICKTNNKEKTMLEIEISSKSEKLFKQLNIKRDIEKLCSKVFDSPFIETLDNKTRILMNEKPKYKTEIIHAQHICGGGNICGDNLQFFNSGTGKMIVVLSDGMGTGGRAAIDSTIASGIISKLVKSGMSFDLALKIANFAMISKSEDESLATLDIFSLDLFTGVAKFLKAGAPFSLIRNKTKIKKIDLRSLPIGIFKEAKFVKKEEKLNDQDIVVMFSDGVIATDENLPEKELTVLDDEDFKILAEQIVDEAINRQEDKYDDDITALCLKLVKNKEV